ncbi:Por secretion system C-terminal sorting domain-containing protein, partial [Maribacter sedimenticola]
CYQTAVWNTQTCSWEATGEQPEMPMTECYQTVAWNAQTCSWEVTGEQPEMPMTECYQTAEWNTQTCSWEVTGEQPEMPETECNETAEWNAQTCNWDIFQNNNDCGSGTIDQCETAFARSTNENVRTCFLDISGITANRWGWTNSIPSVNGSYELELYAAAGQCDITKGALVGNVIVVYENGLVDVTVSVLNGYKMTEAQLYVGGSPIPLRNNGSQTVAPGQYPYHDDVNGDFYAYTFENLNPGDMDNFYVIFHAKVCPNETDGMKSAPSSVMLTAYPIPFKKEINLKITTPRKMSGELYIYDAIGQKVEDFGMHNLKKGENEIKLQVVELPVGMYFIHVKSDYGNEVLKVLRH